MAREMNPEIAQLMQSGMSYEAAKKRIMRMSRIDTGTEESANNGTFESGHSSAPVEIAGQNVPIQPSEEIEFVPVTEKAHPMSPAAYEAWKTKQYGVKQQIDGETFRLHNGVVIPIYRRVKQVA